MSDNNEIKKVIFKLNLLFNTAFLTSIFMVVAALLLRHRLEMYPWGHKAVIGMIAEAPETLLRQGGWGRMACG